MQYYIIQGWIWGYRTIDMENDCTLYLDFQLHKELAVLHCFHGQLEKMSIFYLIYVSDSIMSIQITSCIQSLFDIHIQVFPIFPGGSVSKESACNAGDLGSIPGSGRDPGEGNGNPLQYSCLENSMDKGAWWTTVHVLTQSQTQLID